MFETMTVISGIIVHNAYVMCCVIFYLLYIMQHSPLLSVSEKILEPALDVYIREHV